MWTRLWTGFYFFCMEALKRKMKRTKMKSFQDSEVILTLLMVWLLVFYLQFGFLGLKPTWKTIFSNFLYSCIPTFLSHPVSGMQGRRDPWTGLQTTTYGSWFPNFFFYHVHFSCLQYKLINASDVKERIKKRREDTSLGWTVCHWWRWRMKRWCKKKKITYEMTGGKTKEDSRH